MSGDMRHYQHRGIIPQAIHQVFREIDMRMDKMYKVHVSAVHEAIRIDDCASYASTTCVCYTLQ